MKLIYIVEDVLYLHNRYKLLFNPTEFEVKLFRNGQDFNTAFSTTVPDIVLLDYDLGTEITGLDLATYIRNESKTLPIFMISGNITKTLVSDLKPLAITKIIMKSFSNDDLLNSVREVLYSEEAVEPQNLSSKKRVLAIDDNSQILNLYNMILNKDYEVTLCKSYNEIKYIKEDFDLVIMDFNMPDADFTSYLKIVKSNHPHAKRVLITGFSDFASLERVAKSEFTVIMPKPISPEIFLEIVKTLLPKFTNQTEPVLGYAQLK